MRALTTVLVDADWTVERWLVGSGPEAREWVVAGESFWALTAGRIPGDAAAQLRLALAACRPESLTIVDPSTHAPIRTLAAPTPTGLAIVFQPDPEPGPETVAATPARAPGRVDPAFASPAGHLPGWLRERFQLRPCRWDAGAGCWSISEMSDRITELSGYPVGELLADPDLWSSRVHPEDRPLARTAQALAPEAGQRAEVVYRFQRRDGAWRLFHEDALVGRDADGVLVNATLIVDVTDQQRTADLLRESESRYRHLVDELPGIIAYIREYDPRDGTVRTTYVSPEIETVTGISAERWERDNIPVVSIVHHDDLERVRRIAASVIEEHADHTHEYRIVRPDGEVRWLRNRVKPIARPAVTGAAVDRWHGVMIDITEQREAEERSRAQDARMRSIVEQSLEILVITDRDGTPSFVSPAIEAVLGYTPRRATHLLASDVVHPIDLPRLTGELDRIRAAPGSRFSEVRVRVRHAEGRWRWLEISAINKEDSPEIGGVVVTARDVTDQVLADEALRFRESLLGTLVRHAADYIIVLGDDLGLT